MELNLTVTSFIHKKRDTLDINGYLYIFNRQYQRKIDDNSVFYWICRCGAQIQAIIKNNINLIDPKGKPFSINILMGQTHNIYKLKKLNKASNIKLMILHK